MTRAARLLLLPAVALAAVAAPVAPVAAQTAPVTVCKGILYAPSIGLIACVVDAPIVDRRFVVPDEHVGHLEQTAWLTDDWARIVLAGHTPGVFGDIRALAVGDVLHLADGLGHAERYRVASRTETVPDDTSWLMPTERETLTLITCSQGETMRLIVHATKAN